MELNPSEIEEQHLENLKLFSDNPQSWIELAEQMMNADDKGNDREETQFAFLLALINRIRRTLGERRSYRNDTFKRLEETLLNQGMRKKYIYRNHPEFYTLVQTIPPLEYNNCKIIEYLDCNTEFLINYQIYASKEEKELLDLIGEQLNAEFGY